MIFELPDPGSVRSPVGFLMKGLGGALVAVAPEKDAELVRATASVSLRALDVGRFVCHFDPVARRIEFSRQAVELVWCASLAYYVLFQALGEVPAAQQGQVFDLEHNERTSRPMRLLKWSVGNSVNETDLPWPDAHPKPIAGLRDSSDVSVASELALCAGAYLLHHELAHARNGHVALPAGTDSILQEREADYSAAEWILGSPGDVQLVPTEFEKRALGVSIALSLLVGLGIQSGRFGGAKHPRSFDRLVHTLSRHVLDPHHNAWAMALAILKLHMDNKRVVAPRNDYESCRGAVDDYANILAEQAAESPVSEIYGLGR